MSNNRSSEMILIFRTLYLCFKSIYTPRRAPTERWEVGIDKGWLWSRARTGGMVEVDPIAMMMVHAFFPSEWLDLDRELNNNNNNTHDD